MDDNAFLDLIRDRVKKTETFIADADAEVTRQLHLLHTTRLALIAGGAVLGTALGISIGLLARRRT